MSKILSLLCLETNFQVPANLAMFLLHERTTAYEQENDYITPDRDTPEN